MMQRSLEEYSRIEALLNMSDYRGVDLGTLVSERLILIHNNVARSWWLSVKNLASFFLRILLNAFIRGKWDNCLNNIVMTELSLNRHFLLLTKPIRNITDNEFTVLSSLQESNKDRKTIKINDLETFNLISFFKALVFILKVRRLLSREVRILSLTRSERIDVYLSLFIQVTRVELFTKAFSKQSKTQVFITEYDRNFIAAPIVGAYKILGIPTVTMVHGMIGEYGYTPLGANYVFCWGRIQRTQLIEQGVNPNKVRMVGYPAVIDRANFRKASFTSNELFTVGLAINPSKNELYMGILEQLYDLTYLIENIEIIVKLHPSQSLSYSINHFKEFLSTPKIRLVSSNAITNAEYFTSLDILVNYDSGLGLEAMMHNILVVIPELENGSHQYLVFKNLAKCRLFADTKGLEALLINYRHDNQLVKTDLLRQSIFLNNYISSFGIDSERMIQDNLLAIKDSEY